MAATMTPQTMMLLAMTSLIGGMFYTPNSYIGIGLTMLFVGRVMFRFAEIAMAGGVSQPGADADAAFARNPPTLVIFGLLRWRAGKLALGTHL